jgi:cell division protein ZapE
MKYRASKKTNIPALGSLIELYEQATKASGMYSDANQIRVLEFFQRLVLSLDEYTASRNALLSILSKRQQPKGIYLWGEVGRGKSFLMDMFFEYVPLETKRRVHFHAYMQEVHGALHKMNGKDNALEILAKSIAADSVLLCFDEFQVTNIADAMIMKRLFEALFNEGVVVVVTSNIAPESLYMNGLHRDRFLPFIDILLEHVHVVHLDGGQDYRRLQVEGKKRYFSPLNDQSSKEIESLWDQLTGGDTPEELEITAHGRRLTVPAYARRVGRFHFNDLCGQPLGASDYLALAQELTGLILEGIPILSPEEQDEAHRLQTLVDILYDNKILLVASGEGDLDQLYVKGQGIDAFKRTVSRLYEMCHV